MAEADLFYVLSIALTGEPKLNRSLAAGLLARLQAAPEAAALPQLLQTFEQILAQPSEQQEQAIRDRIMGDAAIRIVAKMLVVLWYTGELRSATPSPLTEEQHFEGVVWNIASAHPPGVSGGYFGHWTYPPDN
jgi:hypothetical protein